MSKVSIPREILKFMVDKTADFLIHDTGGYFGLTTIPVTFLKSNNLFILSYPLTWTVRSGLFVLHIFSSLIQNFFRFSY